MLTQMTQKIAIDKTYSCHHHSECSKNLSQTTTKKTCDDYSLCVNSFPINLVYLLGQEQAGFPVAIFLLVCGI